MAPKSESPAAGCRSSAPPCVPPRRAWVSAYFGGYHQSEPWENHRENDGFMGENCVFMGYDGILWDNVGIAMP